MFAFVSVLFGFRQLINGKQQFTSATIRFTYLVCRAVHLYDTIKKTLNLLPPRSSVKAIRACVALCESGHASDARVCARSLTLCEMKQIVATAIFASSPSTPASWQTCTAPNAGAATEPAASFPASRTLPRTPGVRAQRRTRRPSPRPPRSSSPR